MKQILKRVTAFSASLALSLSSLAVLAVPQVHAATYIYDGGAAQNSEATCDEKFSTGACWAGGGAPTGGPHDIEITADVAEGAPRTISVDVSLELGTLTFSGAFGTSPIILNPAVAEVLTFSGAGIANQTTGSTTLAHEVNVDIVFDGTTSAVSIANGTNTSNKITIGGNVEVTSAGTTLTLGGAFITDPIAQDGQVQIDGVISGAGHIALGGGVVWFTGTNTYSGNTTVSDGSSLVLSASNAGDQVGTTTVASGGSVKFVGSVSAAADDEPFTIAGFGNAQFDSGVGALVAGAFNVTLADVTLSADAGICSAGGAANIFDLTNPTVTPFTLWKMNDTECPGIESVDTAESLLVYSGTPTPTPTVDCTTPTTLADGDTSASIADGDCAEIASGSTVTPAGGTMTITGTLINNGTIVGDVVVDGTLMGSGDVTGNVSVQDGGSLSPGNSPGQITVTGNLTFAATSSYDVEIQDQGTAGTDYDQTVVTGDVDLTGAGLNATAFGTFDSSTFTAGDELVIIDNQGANAVTDTFTGLVEGAEVVVGDNTTGTVTFTISYAGGTGTNDVVLTVTDTTAPTVDPTTDPTATPTATPTTPDTGFAALMTNPAAIMFSTTSIAGAILAIARKYNLLKG